MKILIKGNSGSFKKGNIPWNKGKKCDYVRKSNLKNNVSKRPEVRKKMRLAKLGKGKGYINGGYQCRSIDGRKEFIHHLVWLRANQLHKIPTDCVIHHLDGDKLNNNIGNLQLMPDKEHRQFHVLLQNNMIGANK